nr:glycosyl hydrolase family 65 protein [Saprospiraceae bacterium]
VARNLLIYRYNHLSKAIENACKLGFTKGAALYPMVTMNGEECHNEWEITFEEIHRNGAIAYAIYDFIRYTNDHSYLLEYGLEVLIGIARFWAQRVSWSSPKNAFVILGVTGPNEYENNVNNNWYTNYIAQWCLNYTLKSIELIQNENPEKLKYIYEITNFEISEIKKWNDIIENIYLPEDKSLGIFLQQEGYMDKEQQLVETLDQNQRPINQNWSWDRILRSCFIKQADVLQGLYFFEDQFDESCIERNFNFYEPRTVHESSLSPCVHAILAAKLGKIDKAYEMYLRTARLDLDNYNNDTEDGLHITSMAGTWLSVIKGFAGMRIKDTFLHFSPLLPPQWNSISFNVRFRNNNITIYFNNELLKITNVLGPVIDIYVNNTKFTTSEKSTTVINIDKAVFH